MKFRNCSKITLGLMFLLSGGQVWADGVVAIDVGENGYRETTVSGTSGSASASSDGRYVAFCTHHRLTPSDLDEGRDVYLKDMLSGAVTFLDLPSHLQCPKPQISSDGAFVLIPAAGISNYAYEPVGEAGPFIFSRATNSLVDLATPLNTSLTLTRDGKTLISSSVFTATFVDIATGEIRATCDTNTNPGFVPSAENGHHMLDVVASFDGSRIAFITSLPILPDPIGDGKQQAYIADCESGEVRIISVNQETGDASNGYALEGLRISGDGNVALFSTTADNLGGEARDLASTNWYLYDWWTDKLELLKPYNELLQRHGAAIGQGSLSFDGERVGYSYTGGNPVVGEFSDSALSHSFMAVWDRGLEVASIVGIDGSGSLPMMGIPIDGITDDGNALLFIFGGGLYLSHVPAAKDIELMLNPRGTEVEVTVANNSDETARYVWVVFSQKREEGTLVSYGEEQKCRPLTATDVNELYIGAGVGRYSCLIGELDAKGQQVFVVEAFGEALDMDVEIEVFTNFHDPNGGNNKGVWVPEKPSPAPPATGSLGGGGGGGAWGGGLVFALLLIGGVRSGLIRFLSHPVAHTAMHSCGFRNTREWPAAKLFRASYNRSRRLLQSLVPQA